MKRRTFISGCAKLGAVATLAPAYLLTELEPQRTRLLKSHLNSVFASGCFYFEKSKSYWRVAFFDADDSTVKWLEEGSIIEPA